MSLNKYMHPRNPYKYQKPDFKDLAKKYPEFCSHVVQDTAGKVFLDFKNAEALRILTKTLLKEDYDLDVELPSDRLVPTIPLRLNYLLWIEDIVGKKKKGVKGIDIGTGSSCIYPLLGFKTNKWKFLATDIDAQNVFYAKKNVEKNGFSSAVTVKKVTEDALITGALLDEDSESTYDFCMCNPPFFADHMEAQAILTSRTADRAEPTSVSTASPKESIALGGEVAFVKQMITDSVALRKRVRVYTTMVGKKTSLPPLKEELRRMQVPKYATTEFCQGKTMRWGIAWTFDESVVFPKSPFQSSKNEKPPLTYVVPFGAGGAIYDIPNLTEHLKTLLTELQIQVKERKCHKGYSSVSAIAYENTWSNQRRKRRQKLREQKSDEGRDNVDALETSQGGSSAKDDSGVADIAETMETETVIEKGDNSMADRNGDKKREVVKIVTDETDTAIDESNTKVDKPEVESESGDRKRKADADESSEGKRVKVAEASADAPDGAADVKCETDRPGAKDKASRYSESGDHKRKADADESSERKRVKVAEASADAPDEGADVKCETGRPGAKGKARRYILKWDINLKKPAGVKDITLEMIWRDGQKELMHQVMQYFKNKLKAPC